MAVAFTGFIIVLKFNFCHGVSTEPGFRNCSDARNLFSNLLLAPGITWEVTLRRKIFIINLSLFITCLKSKYRD